MLPVAPARCDWRATREKKPRQLRTFGLPPSVDKALLVVPGTTQWCRLRNPMEEAAEGFGRIIIVSA